MHKTRARRSAVVVVMTAFLILSDIAPAAAVAPDTTVSTVYMDHYHLGQRSYDYNISSMYASATNTLYQWWCGGATNVHNPTYIADAIYHYKLNYTTGAHVGPIEVMGSGPQGTWDDYLACNPTVIGGAFSPFGDGIYYAFAMYYVAIGDVEGWGLGYGRLGAAFSQDGITWRKYHDPVVAHNPPVQGTCATFYGIGSPSAITTVSGGVRLFYQDACDYTLWYAETSDGIHFGPRTQVTRSGMGFCNSPGNQGLPTTANFAWEDATDTWYVTADLGCDNNQRANERGTIGFTMFRMPGQLNSSLTSGTWETLLRVDTNMTGSEINSFPALLRNWGGGLDLPNLSPIKIIYYTGSRPRVPTNATVQQGVDYTEPNQFWDISWVTWNPNGSHLAELKRYQGATHNITTGYQDTAFFPVTEPNVGWIYNSPQPSVGATWALYNCHIAGTANYFNSLDPLCEGQRIVGLNGYTFSVGGGTRRTLWRCQAPGQHFVSNDFNCEGQTREQFLGWSANTASG